MNEEKMAQKIKRRDEQIDKMIIKLKSAHTIRLVLNGEELLHDFDQMDASAISKKVIEVLESYRPEKNN